MKAKDRRKDQTYFLYRLTQDQLARILFPLGGFLKEEVRETAAKFKLVTASKPESMDICFVTKGDPGSLVAGMLPGAGQEGPILDNEGREIGRHKGLAFYTVGQRKGLGLPGPDRTYVVALDQKRNAVIAGKEEDLFRSSLEASRVNWISGAAPGGPFMAFVKIRSTQPECAAKVTPMEGGRARVEFETPVRAVAPGQAAVFYVGEECVGGGEID
jgi:tRNA-specific 2-thiouridylase